MFLSPASLLFVATVVVSVLLIASSPSLMISWIGLELNTISFIPLILITNGQEQRKSAITYFLTQTIASALFLEGALLSSVGFLVNIRFRTRLLIVALIIKLGAAPFHSWLPRVAEGVTWSALFILLTIQKVNPFLILGSLTLNFNLITVVALTSVFVGGVLGLAQTQTRRILVFSSINHVGWILTRIILSFQLFVSYFLLYIIVLIPIVLTLNSFNLWHLNQATGLELSRANQLMMFTRLISLGGLPPFLGFLPKWIVLQTVIRQGLFLTGLILVFISLLTLFYYLRLRVSSITLSKSIIHPTVTRTQIGLALRLSLTISLIGLPLAIFL